ncbi:MAG: glycerol-3-phosphate dehydrogenase/oxidase [Planctomycetes bacterium]|nr:glycerol-3-phosphate dehydrogenase/oxidase [Planctomycetota bacterium]
MDWMEHRAQQLARFRESPLDVVVVGGGIVGAGVARDAALRGLRTGLIEQHDFAFGTSSRSSRLLHGGLRYLAQGRIGLVYQASHEKRVLHRIAPHLARPLRFIFPAYRGTGWPFWQLRVGVKLYDWLCGGRNFEPSRSLSREEVCERVPGLTDAGLTGAVQYCDALTNDARLVLDTLRSAATHGAVVCNYACVEEPRPTDGGWQCRVRDTLARAEFVVRARTVVHATGPWAERLPPSRVRLRLTKGVHVTVDRQRLPVPDAVVLPDGSRILFTIPWGERVILGTTDTDYDGPLDDVRTDSSDVALILEVVNRFFPEAKLTDYDVRSQWAGLRPLVDGRSGQPSDISRAHQIRMPEPGWIDVAGGKLTTYRLIAEHAVDLVCRHLASRNRTRARWTPCRTADEPLLSGESNEAFSGILPPEVTREAVAHYCRNEWAVHLDDVMKRRTSWHFYRSDVEKVAETVADWMAEIMSWDAARRDSELQRYRQQVD